MPKTILILDMMQYSVDLTPIQFVPMYLESFNEVGIEFESFVINPDRVNYYKDNVRSWEQESPFINYFKPLTEISKSKTNNLLIFYGLEDNYEELYKIDFDAVIISGSTLAGREETDLAPGLKKFCYNLYKQNIPTLAICYGLQLIAFIFGGKVIKFSEEDKALNVFSREMGLIPIFLTEAGRKHKLFDGFSDYFIAYASHLYVTQKPPQLNKSNNILLLKEKNEKEPVKYELLAFNQADVHQAFQFGNFYCISFHPEYTKDRISHLYEYRKNILLNEGFCKDTLHFELQKKFLTNVELKPNPKQIFKNFFNKIVC